MSSTNRVEQGKRDLVQRRRGGNRRKEPNWEGFYDFGNDTEGKKDSSIRIASWNLNSFPTRGKNEKFNDMIQQFLKRKFDVIAVNENNVNWSKLPPDQSYQYLLRGTWDLCKSVFSHNTNDISINTIQPGGTGIIATNKMASRFLKQGRDPSGLGRWTWMQFRGRDKQELVVVSVYRPCNPNDDKGVSVRATYRQHKDLFGNIGRLECPRNALFTDLKIQIKKWIEGGQHLVIAMDANEDIRLPGINSFFENNGLKEAILNRHPNQPAVATRFPGSKPIDGVWVSRGIEIQAAGYTPFMESQQFDHRIAWIDLDVNLVLGHSIPPMVTYDIRRLKLNDPIVVAKYNQSLAAHLKQHRVHEKIKEIKAKLMQQEGKLNQALESKLETVDQLINEGMKQAENKCRKLKVGKIAFSEKYKVIRAKCSFWEALFRIKVLQRKMQEPQLVLRAEEAGIQLDYQNLSMSQIKHFRREAQREKRQFKPTAGEERKTYIRLLAERRAAAKDTKVEKEITQLAAREDIREAHRRLKFIEKKFGSGAVTMLEEEDTNGVAKIVTDKEMIEKKCQESCIKRLIQSSNTPFNQAPLNQLFPTFEQNAALTQVCQGTFIPPAQMDAGAKAFLQFLPKQAEDIPMQWTLDEFKKGWKIKREKTSSGDSNIHVGHYKASVLDNDIAQIHLDMLNIATATGFSFKRWQRSLDVMIPKKINSLQADKLRLINLLEPDFNFLNGMVSRKFMKAAERNNLIAKEQFGSRKGHSAIEHAINKVLTMDYFRVAKISAIVCANDAKSCYDRIVLRAAFLALRAMGIPAPTINSMFSTIKRMEHFTRTAFGTSNTKYGGKNEELDPDGVLQGNAFGPGIWVGVSTPILQMMRGKDYGVKFLQILSNEISHICGFAFVDDADIVQAGEPGESRTTLLLKAQAALNAWEEGIYATGGALVPTKSDWVMIDYKWRGTEWNYTGMHKDEKMKVKNSQRIEEPLQQLCHSTGRLTLGVHIAPDGNWRDERNYLNDKAKQWAANIRESNISRADAWLGLHTRLYKSIGYSLPATYMTEKELRNVWAPAISQGIAASGIVRNMDRDIVFGDAKFQGLGLRSPYQTQGIEHIKVLLTHWKGTSLTGILLRSIIEGTKQELGLGGSLFTQDFGKYGALATKGWVKSTWEFLWKHKILLIEDTPNLELVNEGDSWLMKDFKDRCNPDDGTMVIVNRCRLYLQVTTLADILNAPQTHIRNDIYQGRRCSHLCSRQTFHHTGVPNDKEWRIWRQTLNSTYNIYTHLSRINFNHSPWTATTREWKWFWSEEEDRIYERVPTSKKYNVYSRVLSSNERRRTRAGRYRCIDKNQEPPVFLIRVSIFYVRSSDLIGIGSRDRKDEVPQPPPTSAEPTKKKHTSIYDQFNSLPHGRDWVKHYLLLPTNNCDNLKQSIIQGTAVAISDGSFKDKYGTTGFIITGDSIDSAIVGATPCLGRRELHDAYRAELTGLLAMLIVLEQVCEFHQITEGKVCLSCDNDTALERCMDDEWAIKITDSNWDVIRSAKAIKQRLPIKITYEKVKGHVDSIKPFIQMSRLEKLNMECDTLAAVFREQTASMQLEQDLVLPYQGWVIATSGTVVINEMEKNLYQHCSKKNILKKWDNLRGMNKTTTLLIDWEAMEKAMKAIPLSKKIWVVKHVSEREAVGIEMMKRKERDFDHCPRCKLPHESKTHVLKCQAASANENWEFNMIRLHTELVKLHFPDDATSAIVAHLSAWRNDLVAPSLQSESDITRKLILSQSEIGWHLMLDGCIHVSWSKYFEEILHKNGSKLTPRRWTTALIKKLWDVSWSMWDQRNSVLHQLEPDEILLGRQRMRSTVIREIRQGKDTLMTKDEEALFAVRVEELENWTLDKLNTWYSRVVAARQLCQIRNDLCMSQERQLMRAWLNKHDENDNGSRK